MLIVVNYLKIMGCDFYTNDKQNLCRHKIYRLFVDISKMNNMKRITLEIIIHKRAKDREREN
jgi:hypothetical protein